MTAPDPLPAARRRRARLVILLGLVLLVPTLLVGLVIAPDLRGQAGADATPQDAALRATPDPVQVRRGAYLALAANCAGCHTPRGGPDYAGGPGIDTPFGTVFASNLTPDPETGIGRWTAADFRRALRHGRSRDGRLLYPAFPYPNYTRMAGADVDAIFAYLGTLAPQRRPNPVHALRFPYDTQAALAVWRALFFEPAKAADADPGADPSAGDPAARGAYLVNALGHCNACHAGRNLFGATRDGLDLGGGLIPMQNWYAPSLTGADEAGVADWSVDEIVALLGTGISRRGTALGPMADVVFRSTQHLTDADLRAIAVHLKGLQRTGPDASSGRTVGASASTIDLAARLEQGDRIYRAHCSDCHGIDGEGIPGAYPALAGNRAVTMEPPMNAVHVVLSGGFAPATAGNPRPFGMPPFAPLLQDAEVAAVLTMIRNRWGNRAAPVDAPQVQRYRN